MNSLWSGVQKLSILGWYLVLHVSTGLLKALQVLSFIWTRSYRRAFVIFPDTHAAGPTLPMLLLCCSCRAPVERLEQNVLHRLERCRLAPFSRGEELVVT